MCKIEMGRSSADAEVRPKNSAECSARFGLATCDYSAENFGKHSASFVASHLRRFATFICVRRWRYLKSIY